jgi:hypothetical protein
VPPLQPAPLTLTQVLTGHRLLRLLGRRIADLAPQGDLGLGPDPEGPVGFALVRAVQQAGRWTVLPEPLVLSVHGDGQPPQPDDSLALPEERVWRAGSHDTAVRLAVVAAPMSSLLQASLAGG